MLSAFGIGNFKAFSSLQQVPIRPITLVFGANSSGKSSLLHSLLLAHHTMNTGNLDVSKTRIGGEAVDLGGFMQYVHGSDAVRRMTLSFEFDTNRKDERQQTVFGGIDKLHISIDVGIAVNDLGQPVEKAEPRIESYSVAGDGKLLLRLSGSSAKPSSRQNLSIDLLDSRSSAVRFLLDPVIKNIGNLFEDWDDTKKNELQSAIVEIIENGCSVFSCNVENLYPKVQAGAPGTLKVDITSVPSLYDLRQYFLDYLTEGGRSRKQLYYRFTIKLLVYILQNVCQTIERYFREELDRLRYLGPLRSFPPRHVAFTQEEDRNWSANGGDAWNIVRQNSHIRKKVNHWLSSSVLQTPYEMMVRNFVDESYIKEKLAQKIHESQNEDFKHLLRNNGAALEEIYERNREVLDAFGEDYEKWLTGQADSDSRYDDMKFAFDSISMDYLQQLADPYERANAWLSSYLSGRRGSITDLYLVDRRTGAKVSHRDVGIGISQVLPVLVSAFGEKEKIIAMEQPEIHLHPALQAELGDLFIESAIGGNSNTFIIETHSEHLILRLLKRIRETTENELPDGKYPLRADQITVLYVESESEGSKIVEIPVTDDGDFARQWPQGFFDERINELM